LDQSPKLRKQGLLLSVAWGDLPTHPQRIRKNDIHNGVTVITMLFGLVGLFFLDPPGKVMLIFFH
jgi:hypothetical protein